MGKTLICAEKPSVGMAIAKTLHIINESSKKDGYVEGDDYIVTWAIGHLIELSYPEVYDPELKKWKMETLPFLPKKYLYQVKAQTSKQYKIVEKLLNRADVDTIINAGDAGDEGELIQRLIYKQAGVDGIKNIKRLWIDSTTDAEILRGIKTAKPSSVYDNVYYKALERSIEDYAMGINLSRALTLAYSYQLSDKLGIKGQGTKIAVGRVMTCVLGMVVNREEEIINFKPVDFYKIDAKHENEGFISHWKADKNSKFFESSKLHDENGFLDKKEAAALIKELSADPKLRVTSAETKSEKKNAPLLYNLTELQADCTKRFKISPSKTLEIAQSLYEKKLTTYPRTDARVLSSAVAAEIEKNIKGLKHPSAAEVIKNGWHSGIGKTRYTDDSKIADHYAIIPTGVDDTDGLSSGEKAVYELIVRRFLSIFYPPAEYNKTSLILEHANGEHFYASEKYLVKQGFLKVTGIPKDDESEEESLNSGKLGEVKQGDILDASFAISEAKTQPKKRYTTGTLVLAMENAGNLIEDEELREQIKKNGIGTPATRAPIIEKLIANEYILADKKTQVVKPSALGTGIVEIVRGIVPSMLSPEMTANWGKGLTKIEKGELDPKVYRAKVEEFVVTNVEKIKERAPKNAGERVRKVVGKCPVCGNDLIETRYGWLCSAYKKDDENSCKFGIRYEIRGVKLDDKQLEKILKTGESDILSGFEKKDGSGKYKGTIKIEDGVVKIKPLSREDDPGLGKCPKCGQKVLYGQYGAYCTGKCGMNIGRAMGKQLTEAQIKNLLAGKKILLKKLENKAGKQYDAYLTPDGVEPFEYTKKNGESVSGYQYRFKMSFPEKKKKKE